MLSKVSRMLARLLSMFSRAKLLSGAMEEREGEDGGGDKGEGIDLTGCERAGGRGGETIGLKLGGEEGEKVISSILMSSSTIPKGSSSTPSHSLWKKIKN
jgi:hypothetical protein